MNLDIPRKSRLPGAPRILYDGTCRLCTAGAQRFGPILRRSGFTLNTLESDIGRTLVRDTVDEMKVITRDGQILGGSNGIVFICHRIWWMRPLAWLWLVPPLRPFFRQFYAWIAARRHCLGGQCRLPNSRRH